MNERSDVVDMQTTTVGGMAQRTAGRLPQRRSLMRLAGRNRLALAAALTLLAAVLVALLAPWLPLADPDTVDTPNRLRPPLTANHQLGTDEFGRDLLARLVWGARVSLLAGVATALAAMLIGVTLGILGGFYTGWIETVVMRLTDILMAFPYILLAIAIVAGLGPGLRNAMIAIVGFPFYTRLVRGVVLSLREREFVEAARALGAPDSLILVRTSPETGACLVALVVGVLLVIAATATAERGARAPRIGILSGQLADKDLCLRRLRQGLSELTYVEGKTHVLEVRRSEGRQEAIPRLAGELVGLKVDLIVSFTSEAHLSVKQATATIPVVMAASTYPVELGLIASLARPGGNLTGLATFTSDLMAKRVQIIKEALPTAARVAVIREPGHRNDMIVRDYGTAAQKLGINLRVIEVRGPEDLAGAFQAAVRDRAQAVMSTQGPFFALHGPRIAQLALKHRLPSFSGEIPLGPEAGILLSYGPSVSDDCQRAANYVDRILKGARPAELPLGQPKKIESIINLKTARALDLTIPPSLLIQATRIIE